MRNVAKILAIVSSKCEHSSGCHLCSDYNSNVAAVDAIPCILVSALQTYHRLTVDVNHFLAASSNQASHLSKNPTFSNLSGIEQEVRVITSSKYSYTVFENHRKSLIQHCERSELFLHFKRTKVNWKCQKWSIWASFWKAEACGQTELPDMSVLIGQKLVENAKMSKNQMRHFE